ncbi:MAG: hypothetical protein ACW975_02645 [Candidatus Thorarchaeota archaeon]|jgi:hypothetical protein
MSYTPSDHSVEGVLEPVFIEQVGYMSTGNQTALTDRNPNVGYDFPIDEAHDWMGSRAEVDVWNLTKTFVSNGTFDEGISGINEGFASEPLFYPFGWNTWGNSSDAGTIQRTGYVEEDRKYILMEDEGDPIGTGVNLRFQHGMGTIIQFNQTILNTPHTENFVFSLDYIYVRGPLGLSVGENISLVARADGNIIWNTNLADLSSRNQWNSTGPISFSHTGINDTFVFQIALEIPFDLQIYAVDHGFINAAYFTVHVDDIVFNAESIPEFNEVDLQFGAGADIAPITGAGGTGTASINNAIYWRSAPLSTTITANTTVSYGYRIRLRTHRFTNSSWTTDARLEGTSYSVLVDESPALSFHAYLGFLGIYEELTQIFRFPADWENITILDPFKTDVTSFCSLSNGQIIIPTSIMDRLGWWEVTLESPNYAETLATQLYDANGDQWNIESIFRTGNRTRSTVSIGTGMSTPSPLNLVNFTWLMPNGTVWHQESVNGGIAGGINSTGLSFGATNATAGVWTAIVQWQNDTQVALSELQFEVHHSASLSPADPSIDTETGVVQTVFLDYLDAENGDFLMEPTASMTANWSLFTIIFQPNDGRNQWEADFDTSLLPPGLYLVVVNVTQTYFDDASCTFTISANRTGNMLNLGETTMDLDLHQTYPLTMRFEDRFGSGIEGASFTFEIVSGTTGGITWGLVGGGIGGDYSVDLFSVYSGTFEITITAWKDHYEADQDTLFIFVGVLNSSFTLLNESIQAIQFGEDFELFLEYMNDTGHGLDGADVAVVDPPSALLVSETQNLTGGIYSIIFTPTLSEPFTILIQASITNHKTQIVSFTLTVTPISSNLELNFTASTISFDQQCIIHFNLTSSLLGPLIGAEIQAFVNPSTGLSLSDYEDLGGGIYRINATPDNIGIYSLNFLAKTVNHVDSINAFTLHVVEIITEVVGTGPIDALFYGRSRSFTYGYRISSSQIGIQGTTNSTSGVGADWLTLVPLGSGLFNITVVPEDVGSFSITVVIGKSGYQIQNFTFSFLVQAIPITVQMDPPSWTERQPLRLEVTLTDDLGSPVTEAEVQYEVFRGVSSIALGEMDEDSDGVYSVTIDQFPEIGQSYEVHVVVNKDNHETLEDTYQSAIVLLESQEGLFFRLWEDYGIPAVFAFAAFGIVGASYRIRSRRRVAYMERALAVKRRFDDVNNFIGIVILHKTSGLPIYSNVLKGGFEEGMISAFITAITHFRSEFETSHEDLVFEVLPISDIIRAVPTKNLVCAFITVSSASMQMEERMIEFARGVSKLLDEETEMRPTEVNNSDLAGVLERYFEEVMDGFLLRYYKRGVAKAFPKRYRCLEQCLAFTEAADCARPVYIAKTMHDQCKITEVEASLLVLEAIEKELIVPCQKHEIISFTRADFDDDKSRLPDGPVTM